MKILAGIFGVSTGLVAGVAIFTLGGAFGFALCENKHFKDQNTAEETKEEEE